MNFKHLVGKSTLKEGITVHKSFESFFDCPEVGSKKEITLLFDQGQSTKVTLRRLENVREHVHIKYKRKVNIPFLNWLNEVFTATRTGTVGEFLEFKKIDTDLFQLIPITIEDSHNVNLHIAESMHHKSSEITKSNVTLSEIESIVSKIKFQIDEGQSYYNKQLEQSFMECGWEKEGRAIPELDLKFDFRKNGVQVEVEFGNARAYYQDYIKFMLSFLSRQIQLGMLVTPTIEFANILCEIGKQKALRKGRKSYSGMMNFEKAYKEFSHLRCIFDMPIVILGIGIRSL